MATKRFVYADNAATSPLSAKALESMMPFLKNDYANASQPYSFAREAKKALRRSREIIASCIGAQPNEIYFTSGGSESNNWIVRGAMDFGTDIITSEIEHHSILRSVEYASANGCTVVKYIPVTKSGIVELPELYSRISNPGTLVSVMLANNEIGTIQRIDELARLTHDFKCIFHTDAVQALGHVGVDVKKLGVDMLSGSAHKFNGPKGIGFLYIREGMMWPNLIRGGSQEMGLRAGTENIASIVGMATALQENVSVLDSNIISLNELERRFLYELTTRGVSYQRNGDTCHVPGNISLSFSGHEGEMLLHRLDLKGIMVSTGSACDSKETQTSHVLKAIGLSEEMAKGTIRVSFGHQNTPEDAVQVADAIASIVIPSIQGTSCSVHRDAVAVRAIDVADTESKSRLVEESMSIYSSSENQYKRDLAYYLSELGRLRGKIQNKGGVVSPHKPVLMLTIIDLIKSGHIASNKVYFDEILRTRFCEIWNKIVSSNTCFRPNFCEPFVRLATSPFYRLKLIKPIDDNNKAWNIKRVNQFVEYVELDREFIELVRNNCKEIEDCLLEQIK